MTGTFLDMPITLTQPTLLILTGIILYHAEFALMKMFPLILVQKKLINIIIIILVPPGS